MQCQTTSRSLLFGAKQRDHQALSRLCEVYWVPVYDFVRAHRVDHDLAQEVTQNVFDGLLYRDLRKFDLERGSRFRAWLRRVTRSNLLNALKKSRRVSFVEVTETNEATADPAFLRADTTSHDRLLDRGAALRLIDRAWAQLEREKYVGRERLLRHHKQTLSGEEPELSDTELSRQLGMKDGYVRAMRKRVKENEFPEAIRAELLAVGVSKRRLNEELRALADALVA